MNDLLFFILLFFFGAAIGSFIKVLAERLPVDKSITGRSRCDYCRKQIANIDLIPIVSFIFLKGRCRYCKKKLSLLYPIIEIITGVVFVLTWLYLPTSDSSHKIIYLGIMSLLIVIFISDIKYQIIPDSVQLALFFLILIAIGNNITIKSFTDAILSSIIVTAPILLLFLFTGGKGMGFGDVKLAFNIGLLLGMKAGLLTLYIAFITGGVFGIAMLLCGKTKLKSKIAFGPFLVIGIVIMIFWQELIFDLVQRIYGL